MRFTKLAVTTGLGLATVGFGASSASAQPIITGGLVNVVIEDSLNNLITLEDVNVGVALNLAANVCDVNVNVLATQLRAGDDATCENVFTGDTATITQS